MLCYAMLSHFSHVRLCVTPQTAAHQAPPSLGFSRQEHWSGLPLPSPIHCLVQLNYSMGVPFSYICALIYNLPAITIIQTLTFSWHKYCELFFCLLLSLLPSGYPLPCFLYSNCLKMSLGVCHSPIICLASKTIVATSLPDN